MWLVFHKRIMTNAERKRRHLASNGICASCHSEAKTIEHVLRDCPKACQVWESVVQPVKISTFFSPPFPDWLLQCVSSGGSIDGSDECWATRFQNVVADKLATLSRDRDLGEIVWVNPPGEVLDALHHDMARIPV
ncbi:hypothetical protein V6N13_059171 [Hibiscus sabdariffa]